MHAKKPQNCEKKTCNILYQCMGLTDESVEESVVIYCMETEQNLCYSNFNILWALLTCVCWGTGGHSLYVNWPTGYLCKGFFLNCFIIFSSGFRCMQQWWWEINLHNVDRHIAYLVEGSHHSQVETNPTMPKGKKNVQALKVQLTLKLKMSLPPTVSCMWLVLIIMGILHHLAVSKQIPLRNWPSCMTSVINV